MRRMIRLREGGAMKRARRRKCLCCGELFRPDARNLRHQRHCDRRKGPHIISLRKAEKYETRYYFGIAKDYFK